MTWRNKLEPASFRGVEFFIDSHDYEFGRKNIFHDYPFRDDAEVEDQGALTQGFSINAYVLATISNTFNYFTQRDKLIEALNTKGPGLLVHRYLGDKNVAVSGPIRMSERFNEGGIARFQISFKEVSVEKPFAQTIDPISFIDELVEIINNNLLDAYTSIMDPLGDLTKVSNDVDLGMQSIITNIRLLKSIPGSAVSTATGLVTSANTLAQSVLSTPCSLGGAIISGFDSFLFIGGMLNDTISRGILGACSGQVQNSDEANRAADDLSQDEGIALARASTNMSTVGSEFTTNTVTSPASATDQANKQANINLMRSLGLTTACRVAVRTEYTSQDDANSMLKTISDAIDDFLDYLGDEAGSETLIAQGVNYQNDDFYQSVKELKPALKKAMDIIGASLAKIVEYEVGPEVVSTLTLAYDRYEDLSREQEIQERNPLLILNPAFIPGGKTINILSE